MSQIVTPQMERFLHDALVWTATRYPNVRIKGITLQLDDGEKVKMPIPAAAFASRAGEAAEEDDLDDMLLQFLKNQREPMTAKQIRDKLENEEGITKGLSTVQRSLARMHADERIRHKAGNGYSAAE